MNKENYKDVEANIFHFESWIPLTNTTELKTIFETLLTDSNFTIINFIEHHFNIEGYTCVWLLAESHLAIHSFPKAKKSYIQLSSCNFKKKEIFAQKLAKINFKL